VVALARNAESESVDEAESESVDEAVDDEPGNENGD